jgi:ArsR family transcriptional regulator
MNGIEKTLKALADRTRLRILGILLAQEACVCDMQAILRLSQPLLSRHLAYLRSAGLIRDRRVGVRIYCSLVLEGEVGEALREFLQSVMPHFEPFQEDALRMKAHMERSGWMKREIAQSPRTGGADPVMEVNHGDKGTTVQL